MIEVRDRGASFGSSWHTFRFMFYFYQHGFMLV